LYTPAATPEETGILATPDGAVNSSTRAGGNPGITGFGPAGLTEKIVAAPCVMVYGSEIGTEPPGVIGAALPMVSAIAGTTGTVPVLSVCVQPMLLVAVKAYCVLAFITAVGFWAVELKPAGLDAHDQVGVRVPVISRLSIAHQAPLALLYAKRIYTAGLFANPAGTLTVVL